jgi:type I restriction enzyme S subunit
LVKEKKIKKSEPLPPVSLDEVPFDLPVGWEWVRFGSAVICRDGERIPLSREERSKRQGQYDYYGASGIIDSIDSFLFEKPLLLIGEDGANLINRSTPIAFMAYGKYWVNNHAHVLDSVSLDHLLYLKIFINAIDLKPYLTGSAQPKMNQSKMFSIITATPPLAEQKRIVEAVDRLMEQLDRLEAQQTQQRDRLKILGTTATTQLTGAAETRDRVWPLVRDRFATIYDTPENVEQLRQTILQLAVMGRLVPQDPNDEPASVLTGVGVVGANSGGKGAVN